MGYTNISIKSGNRLIETKKEAAEGFTQNDWEFGKKGEEGYRTGTNFIKEHSNVKGKISRVEVKEAAFQQGLMLLSLSFEAENDIITLDFPLKDGRGDYSAWVNALAPYVEALVPGMDIELWLNTKDKEKSKDGKERLYKRMYLKANGETLKWTYVPKEEAPAWDKVEKKDPLTGKVAVSYDKSKYEDFLTSKLKPTLERFAAHKESQNTNTQAEVKAEPTKTTATVTEKVTEVFVDDESLPF